MHHISTPQRRQRYIQHEQQNQQTSCEDKWKYKYSSGDQNDEQRKSNFRAVAARDRDSISDKITKETSTKEKKGKRASGMLRNAKVNTLLSYRKKNAITHIHTYTRPHTERKHRSTNRQKNNRNTRIPTQYSSSSVTISRSNSSIKYKETPAIPA